MRRKPFITLLELLAAVGILLVLLAILVPAATQIRGPPERVMSGFNLRQIGIAMHNYAADHHQLPEYALRDEAGRPLLSWRVRLLPYLEEEDLYKQFNLDEPWDSPHNIELLPKMPRVYLKPGADRAKTSSTHYRVFVGPGTAFERSGMRLKGDFSDGTGSTLLVVEAADAVRWTKPEELDYDPAGPIPSLGGLWKKPVFNALFADCSLRYIRNDLPQGQLRALITRNGGEQIDETSLDE